MEEIDYTKDVPIEPPAELLPYLRSQGKMKKEIILYKVAYEYNLLTEEKEKVVECRCSACERVFDQIYAKQDVDCRYSKSQIGFFNSEFGGEVYSSDDTICPYCGEQVTAYHISDISRSIQLEEAWPMTVHAVNGRLVILQWYAVRRAYHNGTVKDIIRPYKGVVFADRKAVKLMGYYRFMSLLSFFGKWEQRKRFTDTFGKIRSDMVLPFPPELLEQTNAANSKLDIYLNCDTETVPVTYLRVWQKHKNIENLIVQGAGGIINEKLFNNCSYYGYNGPRNISANLNGIDWKAERPAQMLGLNKDEFKLCVKGKWSNNKLTFYQEIKALDTDIKITDLDLCMQYGVYDVKRMIEGSYPVMKCIRYLEKQKKKYAIARNIKVNLKYLTDYWKMAQDIGDNINDPEIMYPQNLVTAHDTAAQRYKHKEDEILNQKFKLRYKELSKFAWELDNLIIRPAKTQKEMVTEGKKLHHCVATYINSHASGTTAIFFIRHKDKPRTPYFTLELDEKTGNVRQNRGLRNCDRTDEVKQFETKWLERVKEIIKGEKKNGKSVTNTKSNSKKRTA